MEIVRYHSLEALPPDYGSLFENAAKESFFSSPLWYRAILAAAREPGEELCLYGLQEKSGGRPLALLLASSSLKKRGPYGARLLTGCQNVYTLQFSPLLAPDGAERRQAVFELVGALAADRPRWDVISFSMMNRDSDIFDHLLAAFDHFGMRTEPYFQFGNWYEDIGGRSFDTYLAERGKNVKKTLAWKDRRFSKRPDAGFEICTGDEGLERAMAAFKKVYETSWKEPEQFPGFIERLIQDCASHGMLRMGNLYLEDEPVATWFIIVSHGTAIGFKTAYDPKTPSNLSVGGVLTYKVMKYLIDEEKVSRIDFGIGDEAYKTQWLTKRRERWGILAYNRRTPKGALLGSLAQGRAIGRKFLRKEEAD